MYPRCNLLGITRHFDELKMFAKTKKRIHRPKWFVAQVFSWVHPFSHNH